MLTFFVEGLFALNRVLAVSVAGLFTLSRVLVVSVAGLFAFGRGFAVSVPGFFHFLCHLFTVSRGARGLASLGHFIGALFVAGNFGCFGGIFVPARLFWWRLRRGSLASPGPMLVAFEAGVSL